MSQPFDPTMHGSPEAAPGFSPIETAQRFHISLMTNERLESASRIGNVIIYGALAAVSMYKMRHGISFDPSHHSITPDASSVHTMPEHHLVADTTSTTPHTHESVQPWPEPQTTSTNKHPVEFNTVYPSYYDNRQQEANTADNRDAVEQGACVIAGVGGVIGLGGWLVWRRWGNKYARLERSGQRARARARREGDRPIPSRNPYQNTEATPRADAATEDFDIIPGMQREL